MSIQFAAHARYGFSTWRETSQRACPRPECQLNLQTLHARAALDKVTLSPTARQIDGLPVEGTLLHQVFEKSNFRTSMRARFGKGSPLGSFIGRRPGIFTCEHLSPGGLEKTVAAPANLSPKRREVGVTVKAQRQRNAVSCGQTSVAVSVNALTGKKLTDRDVDRRYGFALLKALNSESKVAGYRWSDGGDFQAKDWPILEKKLNKEKTPVLMGLNGSEFSPSGRGHIITLLGLDGGKVRYMDPADGKVKFTTRGAINKAASHPDGKFFFYASKIPRK